MSGREDEASEDALLFVRRGRRGPSPTALAVTGFLGGLLAGALAYSQQAHQHSQALFSRYPLRRYLALGYLGGQPSVDTVRLLRDYLDWEQNARLRRRALEVLQRVEDDIE